MMMLLLIRERVSVVSQLIESTLFQTFFNLVQFVLLLYSCEIIWMIFLRVLIIVFPVLFRQFKKVL